MDFIFQILLVLLLVFLNGYFVASEFALVAVRKTRVEELARKGNTTAKILNNALGDLDSYISATQLGITLASLALGWVGEPAIAHFLEPHLTFLPQEAALITSHTAAVIFAFSAITFLHIVLGELAPKSLALQRSEKTSLFIITPLILFTKIFWPVIWVLNGAGRIVLRLIGLHGEDEHQQMYSEEEIKALLTQSGVGGKIPSKEVELVHNVFELGDTPVKGIMVPRTSMVTLDCAVSLKKSLEQVKRHPHSRFPVYENNIDNIIGFVHIKDLYKALIEGEQKERLSHLKIVRKILSVPEGKKIDAVLQDMRKRRIHLAVVHDEYGGTAGIVTLEDVIESLVGEIEDEFDQPVQDIKRQKDGTYLLEGHTLIEDVQDKFRLPLKGQSYTTIGGLVFGLLGHEPRVGDVVQISRLSLKVEKIEGKRIKTLRLKKEKESQKKDR